MTRKEFEYAINSCGFFIYRGQICYEETELIKAFEDMGLIEQEPCENAISGQAVDEIKELMTDINGDTVYAVRMSDIRQLPPVKPQEKTGHWITKIKSDLRGDMWPTNPKCSECGGEPYYSNTIYNYKFCPYCGAKMVEPQESEDKK